MVLACRGLEEAGYRLHLANTAALPQYKGLKYSDDKSDARWLAKLLRLGLLPEGYIYPKEGRAVRDLLRKRHQLVREKTRAILSLQNLYSRNTGAHPNANTLRTISAEQIEADFGDELLSLAATSHLAVMRHVEQQIVSLEKTIQVSMTLDSAFKSLQSISGIGTILGLTIALETGDIKRFAKVGHFASYCRLVGSTRLSNGKRKGQGNTKNGNKYLAWAFIEAANFAIRYDPLIKRYYQRKSAKSKRVVALKAVAHKLARASYYVMRDGVEFDSAKAFT